MRRRSLPFALAVVTTFALALAGCAPKHASLKRGDGYLQVPGGRLWYRVVGTGTGTPLVLLHGGPGAPSDYLWPLAAMVGEDRPVIIYDQLGCGRSDRLTDTTAYTVSHFVDELAEVRQQLGLDRLHVFGHSWGTIVATEFALRKPAGLASIVLASPSLSVPLWEHDADSLRRMLPDTTLQKILRHEADRSYDSPEYQSAMMEYYARHLERRQPWTPGIESTFVHLEHSIYDYMQGPSEFTIVGTLKSYDVTPRLHELSLPVLFTCGQFDEATPTTTAYFASLIPGAQVSVVTDAGHITMDDKPEAYARLLRDFLTSVDQGGK